MRPVVHVEALADLAPARSTTEALARIRPLAELGVAVRRAARIAEHAIALDGGGDRLGLRGVRLAIADPPLARAIIGGLCEAAIEQRATLHLILPAVVSAGEVAAARAAIARTAREVAWELGEPVELRVIASIESVRGCIEAAQIARVADAVEVDLDGLTATMLGISRADAAELMPALVARGVHATHPFEVLDPMVASVAAIAVRAGATVRGPPDAIDGAIADPVALPVLPPLPPMATPREWELDAVREPVDLVGIPPSIVHDLARPVLDTRGARPLALGLAAAPGCGVGYLAVHAASARAWHASNVPYVFACVEAFGEQAAAIRDARGLLSARGGRTSHAAVIAAQSGVPCIILEQMRVEPDAVTIGGRRFAEGEWLSIDGTTGAVYAGALPLGPTARGPLERILALADRSRKLEVWANANTPAEARAALASGATGIGLVRTEHMFLEPDRLAALRRAILDRAPDRLEAVQREDFVAWLSAAGDAPVRFRLLDAPPSEFLPAGHVRPSDALRALRLFAVRPDIEGAQLRALAGAWREVGPKRPLSLILPMVAGVNELVAAIARAREHARDVPLEFGAMMELPRAALRADRIAPLVGSFSWGSNDLTQFTLGLARAIAPAIVPALVAAGALPADPSETIDLAGVARVIAHAERLGRAANPALVTGVCGRVAADPRSIQLFDALGMTFVSVPPAQVGAARVAAAQAALRRTD